MSQKYFNKFKYVISKQKPYSLVHLSGKIDRDSLETLGHLKYDLSSCSGDEVLILDFKEVSEISEESFLDLAGFQVVLRKVFPQRLYLTNFKKDMKEALLAQRIIRQEESELALVEIIKKVS